MSSNSLSCILYSICISDILDQSFEFYNSLQKSASNEFISTRFPSNFFIFILSFYGYFFMLCLSVVFLRLIFFICSKFFFSFYSFYRRKKVECHAFLIVVDDFETGWYIVCDWNYKGIWKTMYRTFSIEKRT